MNRRSNPPSALRTRANHLRFQLLTWFWFFVPRALLRCLPGSSRRFGPPRRCAAWQDYSRRHPGAWREVLPARSTRLPPPFFCNDPAAKFPAYASCDWPAVGVAVISHGRVLDEHGWAVGDDDTLLGDFCLGGCRRHSRANHTIKLHPPQRLRGTTLNLCSSQASLNFYHYLMDAVGRYPLVRDAGFTWADFDHVLLPRYRSAMTAEVDRAIGIPPEKIIRVGRREQFVCDTLVQPSLPGKPAQSPPWLIAFYRELFAAQSTVESSRIYIPRTGRRRPLNAAAIAARLSALGFETVDPLTTPNLRERLAGATHVVGVHGAALLNLMFCRPGTRVLEILPSDIARYHNAAYYYTLCANGDMPYGAVVGPSLRERLVARCPQSWADFTVDLRALDQGLAALVAEDHPATCGLSLR